MSLQPPAPKQVPRRSRQRNPGNFEMNSTDLKIEQSEPLPRLAGFRSPKERRDGFNVSLNQILDQGSFRDFSLHDHHKDSFIGSDDLCSLEGLDYDTGSSPRITSGFEFLTTAGRVSNDLVKTICLKNPSIRHRFYTKGIVRVKAGKTLGLGGTFGENFWNEEHLKETPFIAVSSKEAHLLTLTREGYKAIMSKLSERENYKFQLFANIFSFPNEDLVQEFCDCFRQKTFKKGEVIYSQNDPTREFYLLSQGDVRLFREIELSHKVNNRQSLQNTPYLTAPRSSKKAELPIASIIKGQFFGEELLMKEKFRWYTAIAKTSDTVVYYIDASTYRTYKGIFVPLIAILRNLSKERAIWRKERTTKLLDQHQVPALNQITSGLLSSSVIKSSSPQTARSNAQQNDDTQNSKIEDSSFNSEVDPYGTGFSYNKQINETKLTEKSTFSKNLDLYKKNFSRKIQAIGRRDSEERSTPRVERETPRIQNESSIEQKPAELNVRRELESFRLSKTKLRLPKFEISPVSQFRKDTEDPKAASFKLSFASPTSMRSRVVAHHVQNNSLSFASFSIEKTNMEQSPKNSFFEKARSPKNVVVEKGKSKMILQSIPYPSSNDYKFRPIPEKKILKALYRRVYANKTSGILQTSQH